MNYVKVTGTGIHLDFKCKSHTILANPAGTYHKFVMPDGTVFYLNDFGVRTITIADSPDKLNF